MVKTEPTVPRARLLSLGKKNAENAQQGSYSSNAESFRSSPKSRKRKEASAGSSAKTRTVTATSADDVSRAIKMLQMPETVISHRKTSSPKSKYKNNPCVAGAGLFF